MHSYKLPILDESFNMFRPDQAIFTCLSKSTEVYICVDISKMNTLNKLNSYLFINIYWLCALLGYFAASCGNCLPRSHQYRGGSLKSMLVFISYFKHTDELECYQNYISTLSLHVCVLFYKVKRAFGIMYVFISICSELKCLLFNKLKDLSAN
jgi:hypothetical protein